MRIAVDAGILQLPCPTGVERAALEMLRSLPATLQPGDELIVFGRDVPRLPCAASRAVRGVGLGGKEPMAIWRETRLAPALRSQGADVLWSPVAAIPLRTHVARVATVHELPWRVRPRMEGALRERVHRVRLRLAARSAVRICVPSETTAGQVVAEEPDAEGRVRIVPHAVAPVFLEEPDREAARALRALHRVPPSPYLLHVGGTRARKGVPVLLRAYARYRLQGGRRPLVLAGPGEPPTRMPADVWHLGYVSDDLLLALYAGAGALVVSSESEGFGLPCLEAMAQRVPVVALRAGALPEVVGDDALLVDAGDDDALGAALLTVENDSALREGLLHRGRARVEGATWAASAQRLRGVLREAIEAR
jgi:glycosyltransferase involved in cell wall biosynthesis